MGGLTRPGGRPATGAARTGRLGYIAAVRLSTKIQLGLFGVGLVAITVNVLVNQRKDGGIVLFAPPRGAVRVSVDGAPALTLAAGEHRRLRARRGEHTVAVEGGPRFPVQIRNGFDLLGVPTLAEQCFVELDVTLSHYGEGGSPPKVSKRDRVTGPFQLPKTYYLSEDELPRQVSERIDPDGKIVGMQLVFLYRSVPCDSP